MANDFFAAAQRRSFLKYVDRVCRFRVTLLKASGRRTSGCPLASNHGDQGIGTVYSIDKAIGFLWRLRYRAVCHGDNPAMRASAAKFRYELFSPVLAHRVAEQKHSAFAAADFGHSVAWLRCGEHAIASLLQNGFAKREKVGQSFD